jgi:hypothetical protein
MPSSKNGSKYACRAGCCRTCAFGSDLSPGLLSFEGPSHRITKGDPPYREKAFRIAPKFLLELLVASAAFGKNHVHNHDSQCSSNGRGEQRFGFVCDEKLLSVKPWLLMLYSRAAVGQHVSQHDSKRWGWPIVPVWHFFRSTFRQ